MPDAILALNAGSSSLKFGLFGLAATRPRAVLRGRVETLGAQPSLTIREPAGAVVYRRDWDRTPSFEAVLAHVLGWVEAHLGAERLVAVGHRVVHGGARTGPERVTPALMEALKALAPLAPLHQPHNLSPICAMEAMRPGLPQVASFDTAFHRTMPELATRFALPERFHAEGIYRYGFHGLSYAYLSQRLAELDPVRASGRWVLMHLGSGASLCALHGGRSIDTTMGFTALDGLMMGTRSGTVDPGMVLHLVKQGMSAAEVEDLLSRRSGLLGVSGMSADMRQLEASGDPAADRAINLFVRRILRETGALAAMLEGLDGIVFSAGIGENSARVRAALAEGLGWLGARLDSAANAAGSDNLAAPDSSLALLRIPTDEEAAIASETAACLE